MSEHESHPDQAEEVAEIADQYLGKILQDHDLDGLDEKDRKAIVHVVTDLAASDLRLDRTVSAENARAIIRRVVADSFAPKLKIERDEAQRAAKTDGLTGLANATAFNEALPGAELNPEVCVISFDGDNFGILNKRHHKPAGDAAIIALAEAISRAAKKNDTNRVFRGGGGDEFFVLASPDKAEAIIEEAQRLLAKRLHSGEPLVDAQGEKHPSSWYSELGLSGAWART